MTDTSIPAEPTEAELAEYREKARAWLEANLERREPGDIVGLVPWRAEEQTAEDIARARSVQRTLFEGGYAGITWPKEYGGQGLHGAYQRAFDEAARDYRLPDLGILGGTTYMVCGPTMLAHASPEFLRRHVPRILAGDELVVQFFSDPDAGSDLAAVRTQAVRDGDRWILNGSKIWSSGAHFADIGMCLARTNWDVPKHRGLTWFAVPIDAPGVKVERIRQINGSSEFCQEYFDDVELTDADVIGEVDGGWNVTHTMLLFERGGGAARSNTGQAPVTTIKAEVVDLLDEVDGWDDPGARDLAARVYVDDLARVALGQRIAGRMAGDLAAAVNLASYGKLAAGVHDPIRANNLMAIAGEDAVAWDRPESAGAATALTLLNSRFLAIAGGTVQMQRNTIGERVLGLPREPSFDRAKPFRDVVRDAESWDGQVG